MKMFIVVTIVEIVVFVGGVLFGMYIQRNKRGF